MRSVFALAGAVAVLALAAIGAPTASVAAPALTQRAAPTVADNARCVIEHLPQDAYGRMLETAKTDLIRALDMGRFNDAALTAAYDACAIPDELSTPVAGYAVGAIVQATAESWFLANKQLDAARLDAAWQALATSDRRMLADAARDRRDLSTRVILLFVADLGLTDEVSRDQTLSSAVMAYAAGRALRDAYGDLA